MKTARSRQSPTPADPAAVPAAGPAVLAQRREIRRALRGGEGEAPEALEHQEARQEMETAFGQSFSGVRLRTDAVAASRATSLGARAYTDGREIGFAEGAFAPETAEGRHTLAHEFAHVVQMRGGSGGGEGRSALPVTTIGNAGVHLQSEGAVEESELALEIEADAAARQVLAGRRPGLTRAALGVRGEAEDKLKVAKGKYLLSQTDTGEWLFIFNAQDILAQGSDAARMRSAFTLYVVNIFPGADPELSERFQAEVGIKWEDPLDTTGLKADDLVGIAITQSLHRTVTAWMAKQKPKRTPRDFTPGVHGLQGNDLKSGTQPASGDGEATAPPKKKAKKKPKSQGPPREGAEDGSPSGIRRFVPHGELVIRPELPVHVAGAEITAEVVFGGDSDNVVFNAFPGRGSFDWTVTDESGKAVLTGPFLEGRGDKSYGFELPEAGKYTVSVKVESSYFKDRTFEPKPVTVLVATEADREKQVFDLLMTGPGKDKPFERVNGVLKLKPGARAQTLDEQVTEVNLLLGAVGALETQGGITAEQREEYEEVLDKRLTRLQERRDEVAGASAIVARGTFLDRDHSTYTPLSVVLYAREVASDPGVVRERLQLLDSTLAPADPPLYEGEAGRLVGKDEAAARNAARKAAVDALAADWTSHNDYPNGTIHLAVELEDGSFYERSLDTFNYKKPVKKVAGTVAFVGGLAVLGAAVVFSGGTAAPVGVVVLQGLALGATVVDIGLSLEQRLATGTLHADGQLTLDLLQIAGSLVGAGALAKTLQGAKTLSRGYVLVQLGLDVSQGVVLTAQVHDQLLELDAKFHVEQATRQQAGASAQELAKAEEEYKAQTAKILGSAAVSGGLLLVSAGSGLKQVTAKGFFASPKGEVLAYTISEDVKLIGESGNPASIVSALDKLQLTAEEVGYLKEALTAANAKSSALPPTPTQLPPVPELPPVNVPEPPVRPAEIPEPAPVPEIPQPVRPVEPPEPAPVPEPVPQTPRPAEPPQPVKPVEPVDPTPASTEPRAAAEEPPAPRAEEPEPPAKAPEEPATPAPEEAPAAVADKTVADEPGEAAAVADALAPPKSAEGGETSTPAQKAVASAESAATTAIAELKAQRVEAKKRLKAAQALVKKLEQIQKNPWGYLKGKPFPRLLTQKGLSKKSTGREINDVVTQDLLPDARDTARLDYQEVKALDAILDILQNPKTHRAALPCFAAGTPVWTAAGPVPIERIDAGARVLSWDAEAARVVEREVLAAHRNATVHFYEIAWAAGSVEATGRHRFWIEDRQAWIDARDLQPGQLCRTPEGEILPILSVHRRDLPEGTEADTFNLSVAGTANYFVGPGVLVHNAGYGTGKNLGLGNLIIYRGTSPDFPGKVYIGQTYAGSSREADHQREARGKLDQLAGLRKQTTLSAEDQALLTQLSKEERFWTFKSKMKLEILVEGLSDPAADYLEQRNIDKEVELVGKENVLNRRAQIKSQAHLDAIVAAIKADPKVIAKKLCPR